MNIIIASIRKDLVNSIKCLLEIEIEEIGSVYGVTNTKELQDHINYDAPDMIIVSEDFSDEYEKTMHHIYYEHPEINIIIIGSYKTIENKKPITDEYISNDSPAVIDDLIKITRRKKEKMYI
jgi:DNA-binding NtrC family response regulator